MVKGAHNISETLRMALESLNMERVRLGLAQCLRSEVWIHSYFLAGREIGQHRNQLHHQKSKQTYFAVKVVLTRIYICVLVCMCVCITLRLAEQPASNLHSQTGPQTVSVQGNICLGKFQARVLMLGLVTSMFLKGKAVFPIASETQSIIFRTMSLIRCLNQNL